jgi:hypothetical protein
MYVVFLTLFHSFIRLLKGLTPKLGRVLNLVTGVFMSKEIHGYSLQSLRMLHYSINMLDV